MPHDSPEPVLGASSSFDTFYAANFVLLTTQLYAYFGDRQEAEDVVQEAFCRGLARWGQISVYEDPAAWVRRVAWNLATSHLRRSAVASAFRRRQRPEYDTPGPDLERITLIAAMRTLPPKPRQAVVLHYLADLPIVEIAEQMEVAVGTVKSWLNRARTALATELTGPADIITSADSKEIHHA